MRKPLPKHFSAPALTSPSKLQGTTEPLAGRGPQPPKRGPPDQASPVPPRAAGWPVGEELEPGKKAFTFSIQHLGDVQVLLCHIEGRVQVCERVVLEGGEEGAVREWEV